MDKLSIKEIVPNTGINFASRFSFSPNGEYLLFDNSRGKKIYRSTSTYSPPEPALETDIYVLNLENLHKRELTSGSEPIFSPDGTKIAFSSSGIGKYSQNIYIMDFDGQHIRRLTQNNFRDFWPSFSPDGSSLVFARDTGKVGFLVLLNINSGVEHEIYRFQDRDFLGNPFFFDSYTIIVRPGKNAIVHYLSKPQPESMYSYEGENWENPIYSNDRTKTAFKGWTPGVTNTDEIFIADSKGKNSTQITHTGKHKEVRTFSPDGKSILFISSEKGTSCDWELWQVGIDGSNLKRISFDEIKDK